MDFGEEPLTGGNMNSQVVRVGDTVRRAVGPSTPTVHSLLRHLATRAYPAPRALGVDLAGREMLTYVPGDVVHPGHLRVIETEDALRRVGRLIADYHRAQAGFVVPPDAVWSDDGRDPSGSTEVIAHNDLAPWNLIAGPHGWAFIDWDLAAPGRRMWDLAWALHSFAGLWPDDDVDHHRAVRRIAAFCDGADVAPDDRPRLLDVVVERTIQHAQMLRTRAANGEAHYEQMVADGHATVWEAATAHVATHQARWSSSLTA